MSCFFYILKPHDVTIWSLFYTLFFEVVQYFWILKVNIPKTINLSKKILEMTDIHIFGDASWLEICAGAHAFIRQPSGTKQGLITSKSRLLNKQVTISRLELVAVQIVANLVNNIRNSWQNYNIRKAYGWSDSTIVLHWLQGNGSYKQLVHNIVKYINSKTPITWKYVGTIQNPTNIGDRGSNIENLLKE